MCDTLLKSLSETRVSYFCLPRISLGSTFHLLPLPRAHMLMRAAGDIGQGPWPSPINGNWLEARQEIQARLYWGSWCSSGERKQVTVSLACSPRWGRAGSLYGVRVGVRLEGCLRCFAQPSGGVECRGHAQYPVFVPDTLFLLPPLQKWQLGFLVFLSLFVYNLPQLHMHAVMFSPI